MLDYDAICTFVFKDYKDFARFMYDPGSKALTPDHENLFVYTIPGLKIRLELTPEPQHGRRRDEDDGG